MASYKETPRQKMIAMMYLVLTALLALNVSVEILQAFLVVNESMETTTQSFSQKIDGVYSKFAQQFAINQNKVRPFWEKAQQAKKISTELKDYISNVKYEVISHSEGIPIEKAKTAKLRELATKDKYDEPTRYFIGNSQDGSGGKARELKNKIVKFKADILNLVEPKDRGNIKLGLDIDGPFYDADNKRQPWEMHNFYFTILAADVTILNKLINDVQNAEFDVVSHLYSSVNSEDFSFNEITAKVVPKSNYVLLGDNYEADIFVAAYDTAQNPQVVIGGSSLSGKGGIVKYKVAANSEGLKTYSGFIKVPTSSGIINSYPFKEEYIVARPSLTVSATKMNVFYIGVDNPVSISIPGIPDNKIIPTISSGTLRRDGGKGWIVRVTQTGKVMINAKAMLGTTSRNMGSVEFRVKRVPSPTPMIGNVESGVISRELLAVSSIIPKMPEDFDFDLNFIVQSFSFVALKNGEVIPLEAKGNQLTSAMKNVIKNSRRGDKIWLENIYAKGPDGTTRKLSSISLEIK